MLNSKVMITTRDKTRPVRLGSVTIGGGAPVAVQTMTNTDTRDVGATVAQVKRAARAGAEVVRLAVLDGRAAQCLPEIVAESPVPLVADIHFDYRLALASLKAGVAGIRLNPGNIGGDDKVRAVAEAAGAAGAAIRVGVNSGSLEKDMAARYGGATPEALAQSALAKVRLLEATGFSAIKAALKSSNAMTTLAAVRRFAELCDVPQHVGVTEAGDAFSGAIKSAVGLGLILSEGLGDTLRVSLTAPPEEEVAAAWEILRAVGLRSRGVELISCPTCGRCQGPLFQMAAEARRRLGDIAAPLKVAVMGCIVNGPGEAKEADAGIALGKTGGLLFAHGRQVAKVPFDNLLDALESQVREIISQKGLK